MGGCSRTPTILKTLLIWQVKRGDQQSNDQHNRKLNEGRTMYNIVNFYLYFQLFLQSFQQVHRKSNLEFERFGVTFSTVDYVCR